MKSYEELGGDGAGSLLGTTILADYAEASHPIDGGIGIWMWRTAFDALTIGMQASLTKHRDEWRSILGLPPFPRPKPPSDLFAGDFCGIRIPDLPYKDLMFTPALGVYDEFFQERYSAMAEERGYTRTPINVGGLHPYHDIYPALPDGYADPSLFDSLVSRLQRHNLTPLIFVLDDTRGPDPSYTFKMLDHFRSSGCEFAVGWEMNGWLSPPQMYDAVEAISHELNQKVWVHFTPNHAAIDSPEAASWHKIQPFVHGILFQGNQNDSPEDVGARLEDFTLRLQTGYNGWPHPLKVIAFELQAYNKFHHGWSEAQGRDFTRKVIANMSHKPDGFCDGGYI